MGKEPYMENPKVENPQGENGVQRKYISKRNTELRNTQPSNTSIYPSILVSQQPREEKRDRRIDGKSVKEIRERVRLNIGHADAVVIDDAYPKAQLDEIVEIMVDALCTTSETITVGQDKILTSLVQERLLSLDHRHIDYVFGCLKSNTPQIKYPKQYLPTPLFTAPRSMENP